MKNTRYLHLGMNAVFYLHSCFPHRSINSAKIKYPTSSGSNHDQTSTPEGKSLQPGRKPVFIAGYKWLFVEKHSGLSKGMLVTPTVLYLCI